MHGAYSRMYSFTDVSHTLNEVIRKHYREAWASSPKIKKNNNNTQNVNLERGDPHKRVEYLKERLGRGPQKLHTMDHSSMGWLPIPHTNLL